MEIREGYKQTEVGVIPSDWVVKSVSRFAEVKRGAGSQYIKYVNNSGIRLIRINDFSEDNPVFVLPTNDMIRFAINEHDVLFAGTGASAGASYIPKKEWIGLPHSYNAPRIRTNKSNSKEYLLYSLQSGYVAAQQKAQFVGAAQPFLDITAISNFKIATPPTKAEQTAIATALSDADALIQSLEKLISKKRNIKQGAMQELLKPKEGWVVKKLGELFTFHGGYTASREQLSVDGYCYLHYGDIHGATKTFINVKSDYAKIPKLQIPLKKVPPKLLLNEGDIIFVDASEDDEGTSRHIVVKNPEGVPYISGLHTIVAKSKDDSVNNDYKRYCFQSAYIKSLFKFYAVGTKVSGISKTNILKIEISLPTLDEQTSIATILSDMDAEIAALETKLAKYKQIKQGMMQELLTGRIRLV